jgi:hypothetical protein
MANRLILGCRAVGIKRLQALAQMVHKPGVGAAIAGRFNDFIVPLHQTLRVGKRPLFFSRQRCGQQKDLGLDILWPQLALLNLM